MKRYFLGQTACLAARGCGLQRACLGCLSSQVPLPSLTGWPAADRQSCDTSVSRLDLFHAGKTPILLQPPECWMEVLLATAARWRQSPFIRRLVWRQVGRGLSTMWHAQLRKWQRNPRHGASPQWQHQQPSLGWHKNPQILPGADVHRRVPGASLQQQQPY